MLKVIAGSALGVALIGYCIYFDKQRRMDPDYKRKVHERRELKKETEVVPVHIAYQNEIELAHNWLMHGHTEECVLHLFAALQYCGTPQIVLNSWYRTLPRPIFDKLIELIEQKRNSSNPSNHPSNESMSVQESIHQDSNESMLTETDDQSPNDFADNDDID